MSRVCEMCGKGPIVVNAVTRRGKARAAGGVGRKVTGVSKTRQVPNLQRVTLHEPHILHRGRRLLRQLQRDRRRLDRDGAYDTCNGLDGRRLLRGTNVESNGAADWQRLVGLHEDARQLDLYGFERRHRLARHDFGAQLAV